MAFEQAVAVAAAFPPARIAATWLSRVEHADSHCCEVPARGRTEAVAADGGSESVQAEGTMSFGERRLTKAKCKGGREKERKAHGCFEVFDENESRL